MCHGDDNMEELIKEFLANMKAPKTFTYARDDRAILQIIAMGDCSVEEMVKDLRESADALAKWGWDQREKPI